MADARRVLRAEVLALLALAACGPAPPAEEPDVAVPAAPAPLPSRSEPPRDPEGWLEVHARRHSLAFLLPTPSPPAEGSRSVVVQGAGPAEAAGWTFDDRKTSFLVARHEETSSELRLRLWRAGAREDRASCEAEARQRADLPAREGADIVESFSLARPPEHDTRVEVGVRSAAPGAEIEGFVLAFGGWSHSCFAFAFTTRARGPSAERALAARLARVAHGTLGSLVVESDLSPTIDRRPAPTRRR